MGETPIDPYEAVIADLEARIASMQTTLENIKSLRASLGTFAGTAAPTRAQRTDVSFNHDAFFGMTVADAAKKYLSAIKKTATVNTIADVLVAGGWKTASKNVYENVRAILSRNADFVRINGEFGLAEWYPGRKTNKNRRAAGTDYVQELEELAGDGAETVEVPVSQE